MTMSRFGIAAALVQATAAGDVGASEAMNPCQLHGVWDTHQKYIGVIDERLALAGVRLAAAINASLKTPPPR